MNYVESIKDKAQIDKMKKVLKMKNFRDYLMFTIGINTGLKVCELLNLRFQDVMNCGKINEFIRLHNKEYYINKSVSVAILEYYRSLGIEEESQYIFSKKAGSEPIGRSHAYRILLNAAIEVGLSKKIGMHTLRKTYGYHHFQEFGDIKYLQTLFNHSAPSVTLKYIGVECSKISDVKKVDFEL